jgi:hypothetical protein
MGMLSWLFGRNSNASAINRIWLTDDIRIQALVRDIHSRLPAQPVLVVVHCANDFNRLKEALAQADVPFSCLSKRTSARDFARGLNRPSDLKVFFCMGQDLDPGMMGTEDLSISQTLFVPILGRHFLTEQDDQVLAFCKQFRGVCEIVHFLSFDDPLLQEFSGEWVRNMLRAMGMSETEAIETKMVDLRLRKAQKKFSKNLSSRYIRAESAADWLIQFQKT